MTRSITHPGQLHAVIHQFRVFALIGGPLLAAVVFWLVPDTATGLDGGEIAIGTPGRITAALASWMALWWLTEAVSIYATALLPLALLPLGGASNITTTAQAYAHPLIFLFMGGFILALALEKWHLHRRFALGVLRLVGTKPATLVGGFMFVAAAMSMWITNTATTLVMLPILLSVIALLDSDAPNRENFSLCLLLGVAYSASIGGIGTIVGTVPNMFTVSFIQRELGMDISFIRWMSFSLPLVVLFVPLTWWLLTRWLFPPGDQAVDGALLREPREPWTLGAKLTLVIFLLTASSWIARPLLVKTPLLEGLSDTGIAIIAALLLFIVPVNLKQREFLIDWETALKLPWGILLLFGGGLALAGAIRSTGVGELLAVQLAGVHGVPPLVLTLLVVTLIIFLTELTSNTATTTALVPIFAVMAQGLGINPLAIIIPATIAASCAFMLPVATPPNAIVFGSNLIRIPQMARAGFWLNLLGILLISLTMHLILGLDPALGH
ncbi:MAG: DASS family sodium-coupled anion symporter [Gammaproteobacteria bacterium]|nr:MAG: DASS family sodium-coupled anion symporter [Gammaproteobacteria bacterium]